jgi:carbon-monoxide dehydrogenase medium subunit
MVLPDFAYHRPDNLADACTLGRTHGPDARFLGGGTDVLVDLGQGGCGTKHLISLGSIPDLNRIHAKPGLLHIGAMVTIEEVARSAEVMQVIPALCKAASRIGSVQVRNRATIGGNFCGAVPCADTPPIGIAGDASLQIVGPDGERIVAARDFFVGPRESVLEPGELLVEIRFAHQPPSSGMSYQRFSLRHGSALAVASVAARVVLEGHTITDASVVLGKRCSLEQLTSPQMRQSPSVTSEVRKRSGGIWSGC